MQYFSVSFYSIAFIANLCKKRRILIYMTKTVPKRTSNDIFNMKKVDLDES